MEQKDKELLLKDLCARLLYGVIVRCISEATGKESNLKVEGFDVSILYLEDRYPYHIDEIKPYLRPMSSMTSDEILEYISLKESIIASDDITYFFETDKSIDWLNSHHFDYRTDEEGKTMIELGLALPAHEGMYNIN